MTTQLDNVDLAPTDATVHEALCVIQADAMLPRLAAIADDKLLDWCTGAAFGVHMWASGSPTKYITRTYYELGSAGAADGVPLRELIRAVILILNIAHTRMGQTDASDRAGDRQPELTFAALSDAAKYYIIRGYEDALR